MAASLARQFTLGQIAAMARVGVADLVDPVREVIDAGIFIEAAVVSPSSTTWPGGGSQRSTRRGPPGP